MKRTVPGKIAKEREAVAESFLQFTVGNTTSEPPADAETITPAL